MMTARRRQLHTALYLPDKGLWASFTDFYCNGLASVLFSMHDLAMLAPFHGTWFVALAMATFVVRSSLFPLKMLHYQNHVRLSEATQEFNQRVQPLLARKVFADERARKEESRMELAKVMKDKHVSLSRMVIPILVNMPVFLGMNSVLRTIDYGPAWQWMGACDWRAALATCIINSCVLQWSQRYLAPPPSPSAGSQPAGTTTTTAVNKMVLPVLHVVNACCYFMLEHMPVALNFYIALSGVLTIVENMAVRTGWARRLLKLK